MSLEAGVPGENPHRHMRTCKPHTGKPGDSNPEHSGCEATVLTRVALVLIVYLIPGMTKH